MLQGWTLVQYSASPSRKNIKRATATSASPQVRRQRWHGKTKDCKMSKVHGISIAVVTWFLLALNPAWAQPLASWNEGPVKTSILNFIQAATDTASKDFVPPAQRIAVFDNDGTLWAEQPMYFQLAFAFDRRQGAGAAAPRMEGHSSRSRRLLDDDMKALAASGEKGLLEIMAATHAGMTTEEFARSSPTGSRRRGIRASTGPIPSSSTSRCWSCWPTCAPTASRPSSSRAAASSSCGPGPRRSTASRPSRWSARPA